MSLIAAVSLILLVQSNARRIESLAVVDGYVLASTRAGVFRANVKDKRWQPVDFPRDSVGAVSFAFRSDADKNVYAFVPRVYNRNDVYFNGPKPDWVYPANPGLYKSSDSGKSWKHLNATHDYAKLYHFGSVLYALPDMGNWHGHRQVLASRDGGVSWKDLPNVQGGVWRIFPDPDHPGMVCLYVSGIRAYIWQAPDTDYVWKEYREWDWLAKRPRTEQFESGHRYGVTLGHAYTVDATLGNYFDYDFGLGTSIPGLSLTVDWQEYTFRSMGAKNVRIDLTLLQPDASTSIVDNLANFHFWTVRAFDLNKETTYVPTKALQGVEFGRMSTEQRHAFAAEYRAANKLVDVPLKAGERHTRILDLDQLGGFKTPGTYRVTITYDNSWAMTTGALDDTNRDKFHGHVTSKTLVVKIVD